MNASVMFDRNRRSDLCRLQGRRLDWVVEGGENIPREGAHITMWKHTSARVYMREILWIPLVTAP